MHKLLIPLAISGFLCAQVPNPTSKGQGAEADGSMPIYRVTVVSRTTQAVSYRNRSGWTKVDLKGTALAPQATGHADVNSRKGYIEVKASMHKLEQASRYGSEYLTYVMWAVTPEGRANNLGEVLIDPTGDFKLDVTTELQAFALIVTAEPYFGVTVPSDVVVMENIIRTDTVGKYEYVDAKYNLMPRGQYTLNVAPKDLKPLGLDLKHYPLEIFEARNAVNLALYSHADTFAPEVYRKAVDLENQAENYQSRNAGRKPVTMTAREAVQTAENARIISIKAQLDRDLTAERQAAADREAQANSEARRQAELKAQEEQRRKMAEQQTLTAQQQAMNEQQQRMTAEKAQLAAESAAQQAAREKAAADQARTQAESARTQAEAAKAEAEAARAQAEAAKAAALQAQARLQEQTQLAENRAQEADRMRLKAEQDQQQLRQQLLTQLNLILETRDTARGLIVNMSDVLFDTGRYTLRAGAREKLAKISGIVLAHPGLKLEVEGHTDSVGGDEYNQKLSEQRAGAVQDYLVQQGVSQQNVTAKGFGKTMPVTDNSTAAGRQQNRRVELVVSGEAIGTSITTLRSQQ